MLASARLPGALSATAAKPGAAARRSDPRLVIRRRGRLICLALLGAVLLLFAQRAGRVVRLDHQLLFGAPVADIPDLHRGVGSAADQSQTVMREREGRDPAPPAPPFGHSIARTLLKDHDLAVPRPGWIFVAIGQNGERGDLAAQSQGPDGSSRSGIPDLDLGCSLLWLTGAGTPATYLPFGATATSRVAALVPDSNGPADWASAMARGFAAACPAACRGWRSRPGHGSDQAREFDVVAAHEPVGGLRRDVVPGLDKAIALPLAGLLLDLENRVVLDRVVVSRRGRTPPRRRLRR